MGHEQHAHTCVKKYEFNKGCACVEHAPLLPSSACAARAGKACALLCGTCRQDLCPFVQQWFKD